MSIDAVKAITRPAGSAATLADVDARILQIAFLASFLALGVLARDFSLEASQAALTFAAALGAQACWVRRLGLANVGLLSAVVTSLSICLLVRADNDWVHPLLAALAMTSKFTVRIDGRHVFNPANLATVLAAWALPGAWVSPGQWGQDLVAGGWMILLGAIVTWRARSMAIGACFAAAFMALVALRVMILGQPWAVVAHQACNGALLLFSFFMITDPMTIPLHPRARLVWAMAVAIGAFAWQYLLYRPNGLVTSLFLAALLVPWINRRWPAAAPRWTPAKARAGAAPAQATETPVPVRPPLASTGA